jgi:hypothetical protein
MINNKEEDNLSLSSTKINNTWISNKKWKKKCTMLLKEWQTISKVFSK